MSSIANLALEADKNSQMVDTKQIVTHALNATTLFCCAHQKLNNRRKESIAPALPKEIREVCSSQREITIAPALPKEIREVCSSQSEVTSWLFGDDLALAIKEFKEISSQMRLLLGKSIPNDSFEKGYKDLKII